ncbi:MIP/aquaporin family protein [Buchnera aphidicola]|uniref:Glycerol uptake facilitator protein n=1 Tax=Buchnera aphidicola subsp. Schizaphis graminum (strain Sg) TaxID=198804 RepID=GLPF_BUCAP|nr:MIP/aquaporin family protein [Buchnera aphidicola]Q8K9M9.1 RecName: Full=Glycerol uptake facilitator protein [Buchnera aphidicola str. Sg (Schizaphis graminum)]AAM67851.1 glycerol uptake facilitator protein [Buchnera aphidicola str. Sg (Schizaphis graminum)]AWI49652.1 aquaporin family protein [Buchnera aphidicola (Schizaphis graminum)]
MNFCSKKKILKQCFFEFLGTGLIIFLGISSLVVSKLTNFHFNHCEISCIWGLGVFISICFCSSVSGAHLNPAITIFLFLSSQFNKKKVIPYILSQISGTFFFTFLIYLIFNNLLNSFESKYNIVRGTKKSLELASLFCVFPKENYNFIHDFILEILIGIIFIIILMKLSEKNNLFKFYKFINPFLIGTLVIIINLFLTSYSNITLNPARDLGPRIFLSLIGWGKLAFTGDDNIIFPYFLIPTIAPIIGINLGGWIYILYIKK